MKKLIIALLVGTTLAVLSLATPVRADVNDFVIHDFSGRYELFNDINGGRMRVNERIDLTFSYHNHGILRAIPLNYNGSLKLRVLSVKRDGHTEPYTTYEQAGNEVLKIGDAGLTITGNHTYEIEYEMQNIIRFWPDFDEWYWDINGDQWGQSFEAVSGEVVFPDGWNDEGLPESSCYAGYENTRDQPCTLTKTDRGYKFATTRTLLAGETLTVATPAQKGLFEPRDGGDWLRENWWQLVGIATGLVLGLEFFDQWRRYGRDHKGRGVIVPEFEPPKGLSPAEVGMLMDYRVDGRDLSATIIDLAIRGYLRVHEDKKQLFVFKKREFSLELMNDDFTKLKPHERELIEALFSPHTKGTLQVISKIDKSSMYPAVTKIRGQIKDKLINTHGFIEESADKRRGWLFAAAFVIFLVLIVGVTGWGWVIGLIWAGGSAILYALLMRRRSHAGVAAYEKVKGLQLYMNVAEKDRMKMLQSVDRPYAVPEKTVHLFEKLLPFAVALGVEKTWAKQFEGIYQQPPNWYSGNFSSFHMAYFASSLNSGVSAMNSSFSASSSSSSSGSGGGGFSGGGGGGGGGGGW